MTDLRVLSVASEVFPLVKTGGLADVAGALPAALAPLGVAVRTMMPGYPAVMSAIEQGEDLHHWKDLFGGKARLIAGTAKGLDLLALDAPHLYDRPGNPYLDATGKDWPDNALRFAALSFAAADVGRGLIAGYQPDVIHAHDWQAGLVPVYLRYGHGKKTRAPGTVVTVHNLAYQGQFPHATLEALKLPSESFTLEGVEYYGQVGFLKGALSLADRITTVSPTYAQEIQTREMGMGLDGLLRHRAQFLSGILNGIDTAVWNPAKDPLLSARYDGAKLGGRKANKAAIRERFNLAAESDGPLLTVISRLTWQKGIDLALAALPQLVAAGGQLALLGSGDAALQSELTAAAARHPGSVGIVLGYDEALSHLLQGGADAILIPSRFEPCGLTQLYGLRYGTVPIVAHTGGLADTVIDANEAALAAGVATGFQFAPVTAEALDAALERVFRCYREPSVWKSLQKNGMASDVSWQRPAEHYAALFRSIVPHRAAPQRAKVKAV
ncbi:MAG TPA: glycogen synthase GlgA [Candidatus Cybelea sp.]|nr:glycogen synthase GlgA [Candidatus Cybelea sp.]